MKRQTISSLVGALCLTLALAGCSSSKHATRSALPADAETTASTKATDALCGTLVAENAERTEALEAVTSKVNLTLKLSGKSPVKLGGTLRIRRNQVVQLSVTYLLGIEVGRLEITPDGLMVIDRVNKRYVDIPFAELSSLTHANLDFYTLQALFLNELFLPGQTTVTASDAPSFTLTVDGDDATLAVKKSGSFSYQFLTALADRCLKRSRIGYAGTSYALNWDYDSFRTLGNRTFPGQMQVDFEGGSKPASLTLELNKLGTDTDWETRTQISSKYERVEWQDLITQLIK